MEAKIDAAIQDLVGIGAAATMAAVALPALPAAEARDSRDRDADLEWLGQYELENLVGRAQLRALERALSALIKYGKK
jgi:hypothetical protein